MIGRDMVIAEARRWQGVRWQHLGRNEHGVDCAGLVVVVCAALGLSNYDLKTYPREPVSTEFLGQFTLAGGIRIPINSALPGDLILFREQRYPCHVAFLSELDGLATIIHAHTTRRQVLEEVMIQTWLQKRVAAIRIPGVA